MQTNSPLRRSRPVTVHLEPELKDALARIAQQDGRTLSNLIRKLAETRVRAEQSAAA
jgi:predicted DNA-binding ribbon-helix-helix protein